MKRLSAGLAVPALALLLTLTACSGDDSATAEDPAPKDAPASSDGAVGGPAAKLSPPPTPLPAGEVSAIRLGTVLDDGSGPQLCLGPIMESYPPQCSGLPLADWDWAERQGFEEQGPIKWGDYAVSGNWDGSVLAVTDAIPAALYDAMVTDPPSYPKPATPLSEADTQRVLDETRGVPGLVGSTSAGDGQVHLEVAFDDGTVQEWADGTYGETAVIVTGVLVERTP